MAVKKGLTFNTTRFLSDFTKLTEKGYPKAAKKGMFSAMAKLKLDADNLYPKTPKARSGGDLKSSGKPDADIQGLKIVGTVTYEKKYAAYQHEGQQLDGSRVVRNYSEPGSGKKFLEKKLIIFNARYMNIITEKIRRTLGF